MPSFTSNFDERPGAKAGLGASVVFLGLALLLIVGLEVLARIGVPRFSRSEQRIEQEYPRAASCGAQGTHGKQVLFLGSSYLLEDVHFGALQQALEPHAHATRLVVEDTKARDWYFGLRRLYDEGARPDVVVLMLSPIQVGTEAVRGEYTAYRLVRAQDLLLVADELRLSNTEATNFAAAHFSSFFGLRAEIRKYVVGKFFIPDLPQLTQMMLALSPRPRDEDKLYDNAVRHLQELRQVALAHGSKLIVVLAPAQHVDPNAPLVERAGKVADVPVLVPVRPGSLPDRYYADGFHMNSAGAEVFTPALAQALEKSLR